MAGDAHSAAPFLSLDVAGGGSQGLIREHQVKSLPSDFPKGLEWGWLWNGHRFHHVSSPWPLSIERLAVGRSSQLGPGPGPLGDANPKLGKPEDTPKSPPRSNAKGSPSLRDFQGQVD
uniref:Uncharacterized protein n=1 Tax=Sphaerodactylus townsendi TaxID=933632 RepID=A0ACB8FXM5_9SAUR